MALAAEQKQSPENSTGCALLKFSYCVNVIQRIMVSTHIICLYTLQYRHVHLLFIGRFKFKRSIEGESQIDPEKSRKSLAMRYWKIYITKNYVLQCFR